MNELEPGTLTPTHSNDETPNDEGIPKSEGRKAFRDSRMLVREFAVVSYRWYLPHRASTFVIPSSLGVSDFDIDSRHRPKIRLGHLGRVDIQKGNFMAGASPSHKCQHDLEFASALVLDYLVDWITLLGEGDPHESVY